jgi:hypothetical protein
MYATSDASGNPDLMQEVMRGEILDTEVEERYHHLHEIQGSLEALTGGAPSTGAVVSDEKVQLTDHQQQMVDDFKTLQHEHKGAVYAVADKRALEAYVDNKGNLRLDGDAEFVAVKPLSASVAAATPGEDPAALARLGPNVFGSVEVHGIVVPKKVAQETYRESSGFAEVQPLPTTEPEMFAVQAATEGFGEMAAGLFRKAVFGMSKQVPEAFTTTSKALKHYVGLAQMLRERLLKIRPLLEKRDFPLVELFEYGEYARFFQVGGKSINSIGEFEEAMAVQNAAMRLVYGASEGYCVPVTENLLEALQSLHSSGEPDVGYLEKMRDGIESRWAFTWKDAALVPKPGQTPQHALNAYPDRKFLTLAPLLDNRYLVAHSPKKNGGDKADSIIEALKHYGASLVFDKSASKATETSMPVPNCRDLLKMLDETVELLNDMQILGALAKKNEKFSKDIGKALEILNKKAQEKADPAFWGFIGAYFKVASSIAGTIQQPYLAMAWMYIRCAMVVASLAELSALEDPKDRIVSVKFLAKQNTEFSNPAMESYGLTLKALRAAQRASS